MKFKSMVMVAAVLGGVSGVSAATVFLDTFSGPGTNLPSKVFDSGATTAFNHWAIGASGDMGAGFFSVVNKARDVHSQFVTKLDADNDVNGKYAIFNGFSSVSAMAYKVVLTGLVPGATYSFSAAVLPLAPNPPYAQNSVIELRHNGSALLPTFQLDPVPANTEEWEVITRSFVATGVSDELTIWNLAGLSNSGNDFGIDNVMVAEVIPLPTSALMGMSGLGMLLARRRVSR